VPFPTTMNNRKRLAASAQPSDMVALITIGDLDGVKALLKAGLLRPDAVLLSAPPVCVLCACAMLRLLAVHALFVVRC
jgi:hypothetical protein